MFLCKVSFPAFRALLGRKACRDVTVGEQHHLKLVAGGGEGGGGGPGGGLQLRGCQKASRQDITTQCWRSYNTPTHVNTLCITMPYLELADQE